MASPLFPAWSWNIDLPEPFNDAAIQRRSTTHYSQYCSQNSPRSTLHSPTLRAILKHIAIDTSVSNVVRGTSAIGLQGSDFSVGEYETTSGSTHAVFFNRANGEFKASIMDSAGAASSVYEISNTGGQTGSALLFTLMPFAMENEEFSRYYKQLAELLQMPNYSARELARPAYVLCDNLYRRIERNDIGDDALNVNIPDSGILTRLTTQRINNGEYTPTSTLYGAFRILSRPNNQARNRKSPLIKDWSGKYANPGRILTDEEMAMVPKLPEDYLVSEEVEDCVKHICQTQSTPSPFVNFLFRGPSGSGKTVGARMVAEILGRPYAFISCEPNTDQEKLGGGYKPSTGKPKGNNHVEFPAEIDIQMDPATAYFRLTGTYDNSVGELEAYKALAHSMRKQIDELYESNMFQYVDSELVKAVRNGYVIEIQELTIIKNQAVPVGLNALLDDQIKRFVLSNGEVVERHPDTVVIFTGNKGYVGCRNMNESVISRNHLIYDFTEPGRDDMIKRIAANSGCKDIPVIRKMVRVIENVNKKCQSDGITGGVCGTREGIYWAISYGISKDIMKSAERTIIASATDDEENQKMLMEHCLKTVFAA